MTKYIIETTQLTKKYKKTTVVNNINMKIEKGKIYALLGRNGAGKTTTMCMLLNLIKPTSGQIHIFNKNTQNHQKEIYKKIGSIIETPGFYENLTAKENLKIFTKIRGDYNEKQIQKVLEIVNLKEENKKYKQYSLGMKQRLGIAAAIIHKPELLILDEPINGLDPVSIREIRKLLQKLVKEYNLTILISSHILNEIEHLADVIGVMDHGELIQEITREDLHEKTNKKLLIEVDNKDLAKKILTNKGLTENIDYKIKDEIELYNHFNDRSTLNKEFINNGINVNRLSLEEENLEEYFTNLIGEI
ncbi:MULTISPECIES: ABC transporter ATP-binding protein [unclassified Methanobrevibacter]|jgi:ABC-type multidrug transport system ATPase subunit|uniref:ABC transporter ATP-binding protein n=1 Tax=unclassified Methanobrevibacter TaxID=2638681 RepID=UPI0039B8D908